MNTQYYYWLLQYTLPTIMKTSHLHKFRKAKGGVLCKVLGNCRAFQKLNMTRPLKFKRYYMNQIPHFIDLFTMCFFFTCSSPPLLCFSLRSFPVSWLRSSSWWPWSCSAAVWLAQTPICPGEPKSTVIQSDGRTHFCYSALFWTTAPMFKCSKTLQSTFNNVCVSPDAAGLLPPSSSAVVVCLSPVPPPPLPASSSDWRTAPLGWSCTQTLLPADSPSLGLCWHPILLSCCLSAQPVLCAAGLGKEWRQREQPVTK